MPRLLVKFPTRNRPEKFQTVFDRYVRLLSDRHPARFVVTMDEDDPTMNTPAMRRWLDSRPVDLKYRYGGSKTKIEAVNADLDGEEADVLLVASDDMVPEVPAYDEAIFRAFRAFPDFRGAVRFWDGLRAKDDPLMTLAVLGWPLYREFGYVYHPDYLSLFADQEQTRTCMKLGVFAVDPACIIRHRWTAAPFDALHARNENPAMYAADHATYLRRQAAGFDLARMGRKTGRAPVAPPAMEPPVQAPPPPSDPPAPAGQGPPGTRYNLAVPWFVSDFAARQTEIVQTVEKNRRNPALHVLLHARQERPTFRDMLDLLDAHTSSEDQINIVANTDIFFDDTLLLAGASLGRSQVYALARFDVEKTLDISTASRRPYPHGVDAWIYRGKSPKAIGRANQMGTHRCDLWFTGEWHDAGYEVLNPCLSIKAYHNHASRYRTWLHDNPSDGRTEVLPPPVALTAKD